MRNCHSRNEQHLHCGMGPRPAAPAFHCPVMGDRITYHPHPALACFWRHLGHDQQAPRMFPLDCSEVGGGMRSTTANFVERLADLQARSTATDQAAAQTLAQLHQQGTQLAAAMAALADQQEAAE